MPVKLLYSESLTKSYQKGAARNATKNGTVLGRPGIRFEAPNIITKGAKISRKFAKKMA
jgi:hypothetical protein